MTSSRPSTQLVFHRIQLKIEERKKVAAEAAAVEELNREKMRRLDGQQAQKEKEEYEKKKAERESYLRKKVLLPTLILLEMSFLYDLNDLI